MRRATPPPSPLPKPSSDLTTWTFDLETITPILGGGVEPFEPDTIDIVRVPGIRGHLRWWWRALFATTHDLDNPEELLKREAKLWGGLVEPNPERSPVRLRVEITSKSAPVPAGHHEWREPKDPRDGKPGRHNPLPTWERDLSDLGYGLFPMMRDAETLRLTPGKKVFTKSLRRAIRFRLIASFRADLTPSLQVQLLAALWMWFNLGGVGARTRRGFGAIAVKQCTLSDQAWVAAFDQRRPFDERLRSIATQLRSIHHESPIGERLATAKLFVGTRQDAPLSVHGHLVRGMAEFRQGKDIGRPPPTAGKKSPGPSYWPEPALLRALYTKTVQARRGQPPRWEHPPPTNAARFGAPRAAFGMPLKIEFKREDREDSRANATLYPEDGQRWPSPLLLRPLAVSGGKAVPAVLVLSGPRSLHIPQRIRVQFKDESAGKESCTPAMDGAASHLTSLGTNALQAFWRFIRKRGDYTLLQFSDLLVS